MTDCDWGEDKRCKCCGHRFTVLHPSRWAYKIREGVSSYTYFCSWKCLQHYRKQKEQPDMSKDNAGRRYDRRDMLEEMTEAFCTEGKTPQQWLKEKGYADPSKYWFTVRKWARVNAPDLMEKMEEHGLGKKKRVKKKTVVEVADRLPEEVKKVELAYDPSIKEEYERELKEREEREARGRLIAAGMDRAAEIREGRINGIEPLEPASLWSRVLPNGTFKKVTGMGMMLCGMNYQITLTAYEWFRLTEEIMVAIRQLKADKLTEEPHEE